MCFQQSQPISDLDWEDGRSPHNPGIQHFRERMATTNGFVRNDSDPSIFSQKLTYKVCSFYCSSNYLVPSGNLAFEFSVYFSLCLSNSPP